MRRLDRRPHPPLLSDTDRAFLVVCGPDAGPSRGMTGDLLTLPRPSSAVRCRPSLQVDGSPSSAEVAREWHESVRLAVNLAVKSLSNQCKDAAARPDGSARAAPLAAAWTCDFFRVSKPPGKRCADRRSRRSRPTVRPKVTVSALGAQFT
jgi:hypothetical protein